MLLSSPQKWIAQLERETGFNIAKKIGRLRINYYFKYPKSNVTRTCRKHLRVATKGEAQNGGLHHYEIFLQVKNVGGKKREKSTFNLFNHQESIRKW
jgi:hypothetical protein